MSRIVITATIDESNGTPRADTDGRRRLAGLKATRKQGPIIGSAWGSAPRGPIKARAE